MKNVITTPISLFHVHSDSYRMTVPLKLIIL